MSFRQLCNLVHKSSLFFSIVILGLGHAQAKVVVFWQPGFPTVSSEPIAQQSLMRALDRMEPVFADEEALQNPATLHGAELLVLPYGSAVPAGEWSAIEHFLRGGGNLLVIGGQPLYVPVVREQSGFHSERGQDTYARTLEFRHTYEVPVRKDAHFIWRPGFEMGNAPEIRAKRFFAVEGHLDGLGYMSTPDGSLEAAPVIVSDQSHGPASAARIVALDFDPVQGYWESEDGIALIRESALFARQHPVAVTVESLFSTIRPGELPVISIHLRAPMLRKASPVDGKLKVVLSNEGRQVESAVIPVHWSGAADLSAPFHSVLPAGFYAVSAVYSEAHQFRGFHKNGFWVQDPSALATGDELGTRGDFLTRNGASYLPVGTNYFSTEANGWDFSGPRNAWVWEHDFDEMERSSVNFARTGVWMPYGRLVENNAGGGVSERFLRNLEAFLLSAKRHHIVVNFTFFAFAPRLTESSEEDNRVPPNPYLSDEALSSEASYVRSIVERFKDDPSLTWDLINEPSFSNPRLIFRGNVPNGDAAELAAWRAWLRKTYSDDLAALASAWSVPANELTSFDAVPLPSKEDLEYTRYGNPREVRAVDYNLFAQQMFIDWVQRMIQVIRNTGSKQLVDVGQDEGGVTDRVLNQFYGGAGLSFTTNHTYWQDDGLLWDSVVAKRPGVPNITGETGYQPVWSPDGTWRYDEFTGLGLIQRKWALGFAAGSTGAVQWDWDREVDFGMKRSDGSSKIWQNEMRNLGEFAAKAAPFVTDPQLPEVAIVLPQSLQLSVYKTYALEAQQSAVRALYGGGRSAAYAVGEYQIELLGSPKLIVLPSPLGLTEKAWTAILERVQNGATLLVTGPFDADAHLHSTQRQEAIGLPYTTIPLTIRDAREDFPWGQDDVQFAGNKTTTLSRAQQPSGAAWSEKQFGKGRILFCALPLELNENPAVLRNAYRYALKAAHVDPVYSTEMADEGILMAPTIYPKATLYVITSESNRNAVSFTDVRSGKEFQSTLTPGSAAILLVGTDGTLLSTYNWPAAGAK